MKKFLLNILVVIGILSFSSCQERYVKIDMNTIMIVTRIEKNNSDSSKDNNIYIVYISSNVITLPNGNNYDLIRIDTNKEYHIGDTIKIE